MCRTCLPAQDVGCCFGQELRKAILDGYPEANMVASDLSSEYWWVVVPLHLSTAESHDSFSKMCATQRLEAALALCVFLCMPVSHVLLSMPM